MKKVLIALALTVSFPVLAQTALKVNGDAIPAAEQKKLLTLLKNSGVQGSQAEQAVQNILISEKIIGQEAWRQKIAQDPVVQRQLAEQRTKLYRERLVQKYLKKNPVTQAETQQAYEQLKKQYNPTEIKVRHILVKTEKEAKDLLYLIEAGEDMGVLAQKNTLDKGTAKEGGVIPFTNVTRFSLPNFAEEAVKLKKGQVRKQLFKSDLGYHIMKLEDTRQVPFPELSKIKSQVESQAANAKANGYIQSLYKNAKVEGLKAPSTKKTSNPKK